MMEVESLLDPNYMVKQFCLTTDMRAIAIDWLVRIQWAFQLSTETLYLTVHIFDCYLSHKMVSRSHLQLVAAAAMLVASEEEEIFSFFVKELVHLCAGAFTTEQMIQMAEAIRRVMRGETFHRSSYSFLTEFLSRVPVSLEVRQLSYYILERTLISVRYLQYTPRQLAAASLQTARLSLGTTSMTRASCMGYTQDELRRTASDMSEAYTELKTRQEHNLRALKSKYSSDAFYDGLIETELDVE